MGSLEGKAAVVTGAGSGLGLAIATALAGEGAAVCVAELNAETGRAVAGDLARQGRRAVFAPVNVADAESARRMVETTVQAFGSLDILVNNAGLQHVASIVDFPEERWNHLLSVLLTGTFLCTKYALPQMIQRRWGRVINVASAHGLVASPFKAAYVAAKHGVVGFTKVAAWEVAAHGITVNAICPGYVRTPLVERQIADQARVHGIAESEVVGRVMLEPQAVKRLLEPSEVGALALYLCSDAAAAVTGAALPIDGGWTAR